MLDIILSGCNGRLGRAVSECAALRDDCRIVAGIDVNTDFALGFPIYKSFSNFDGRADVIIDFSNPNVLKGLLDYAVKSGTPAVIATTGLNNDQLEQIKRASNKAAIFSSANMSLGVSLLSELAKTAAAVLGDSFDIEIVEAHHNQKIDAPSGTALMLANDISDSLAEKPRYEYNRQSKREKRSKNEIGIHSIRGGTIAGDHEIIFAGHDEVIKLSHSAGSKSIFAEGAINAAIYISCKAPGLYNMKDLIKGV